MAFLNKEMNCLRSGLELDGLDWARTCTIPPKIRRLDHMSNTPIFIAFHYLYHPVGLVLEGK